MHSNSKTSSIDWKYNKILDIWGQTPAPGDVALVSTLGLILCESSIILDWIISLRRVGGRGINKSLRTGRGTDEFPPVVFVTPALYCKTEMILFPWQLCVNVLCAVFLHFMPSACSVYHCLLSDWGYCTVSLVSVLVEGEPQTLVGGRLFFFFYCCSGFQTPTDNHIKLKITGPNLTGKESWTLAENCNSKHKQTHSTRRVLVCVVWVWDASYHWICVWFVFLKVRSVGDWEWDAGSSYLINTSSSL